MALFSVCHHGLMVLFSSGSAFNFNFDWHGAVNRLDAWCKVSLVDNWH